MSEQLEQEAEDIVTDVVRVEYDAVVIKCTKCERPPIQVNDPRAIEAFRNGVGLAAKCNGCGHRMNVHQRRLLG